MWSRVECVGGRAVDPESAILDEEATEAVSAGGGRTACVVRASLGARRLMREAVFAALQ